MGEAYPFVATDQFQPKPADDLTLAVYEIGCRCMAGFGYLAGGCFPPYGRLLYLNF